MITAAVPAAGGSRNPQQRLARHYIDRLRLANHAFLRGGENVNYALSLFDQDRAQIEHWQAWAAARASYDADARRLCSAFPDAGSDLLALRQDPQVRLAWLKTALSGAQRLKDRQAEIAHLLALSSTHTVLGDYEQAITTAQGALTLARQLDRSPEVARALYLLGEIMRLQGNLAAARAASEQSLATYQTLGDERGLLVCMHNLGRIYRSEGDYAAARAQYERCNALLGQGGNEHIAMEVVNSLGVVAWVQGDHALARECFERSLQISRNLDDRRFIANELHNLGTLASAVGDYARARIDVRDSLTIHRELGDRSGIAYNLKSLGALARRQGEYNSARAYLDECLALRREMGESIMLILTLLERCELALDEDNRDDARAILAEAAELAGETQSAPATLDLLRPAARLWIKMGRGRQAAEWVGLVSAHPATEADTRAAIQTLIPALETVLDADALAQAVERGRVLDLDTIVDEILSVLHSG